MKPLPSYAVFLTLIFIQATQAQKIVYSPPEKTDYNRFRFQVITKRDDKILVFKSVYFGNPSHGLPSASPRQSYANPDPSRDNNNSNSGPINSIEGATISIYDSTMHITTEKTLPLPRAISGVHFLAYDDFFYIFYQYLAHHAIYCMAAKVGLDGEMRGSPIKMDSTTVLDIHYESQIYSVIYSEDKQHILLFCVNVHDEPSHIKSILFDKDLRPRRITDLPLTMESSQYLSEFHIDNDGNFIFVGMNGKAKPQDEMQAVLFVQPVHSDSLYFSYFVPPSISIDNIRLLVDNRHKRYILSSFYSKRPEADIAGLFCLIRDAEGRSEDKRILTVLSDSLLRAIKKGRASISLNDCYIQDLHLRTNGGFTIETLQLKVNPDHEFISRWNYLSLLRERVATEFAYFDPYEVDHYYPWKVWHRIDPMYLSRITFSSRGALIAGFDSTGLVEWVNVINTPQLTSIDVSIGYKTIVANGLLYFLFNDHIRQNTFLTARSIDVTGNLDTDSRFREDLSLRDLDNDYLYFPRLAKTVDAGEVILPCRKAGFIYLAKINF